MTRKRHSHEEPERPRRKDPPREVEWPYSKDCAKEIRCYVCWAPSARLYVWRRKNEKEWRYTLSAGPNDDRSHTGLVGECRGAAEAEAAARDACKKNRSWYADRSVVDQEDAT